MSFRPSAELQSQLVYDMLPVLNSILANFAGPFDIQEQEIPMNKLKVLAFVIIVTTAAMAEDTFRHGQFEVILDSSNGHLPVSLKCLKDNHELLRVKDGKNIGLNLTFTDFEFRRKVYREENRDIWGRENYKFTIEAKETTRSDEPSRIKGYTGVQVRYASNYANTIRRILFHDTEARARIEYELEINRNLIIHDTEMFGVDVSLAKIFSNIAVGDVRSKQRQLLIAEGAGLAPYRARLVNPGPAVLIAPKKKIAVLLNNKIGGDLPNPVPPKMARLQKGQKITITIDIECFAADDRRVNEKLMTLVKALPEHKRAYLLVENARLLKHLGREDEAEKALLLSAELNKDYATPYLRLANYRNATLDSATSFTYAAYRMPYNYGFVLSGRGFASTKGLTLGEQRNAIFNMLITAENYAMIPNYYSWVAQPFEKMGMHVQALAVYRQALWAELHLAAERQPEADLEKVGAKYRKKIADLEKKVLSEFSEELPELVPVKAPLVK